MLLPVGSVRFKFAEIEHSPNARSRDVNRAYRFASLGEPDPDVR